MSQKILLPFLLFILSLGPWQPPQGGPSGYTTYLPVVRGGAAKASLKWAYGGCYSSWCETGWYSSPALLDVNGDGKNDVIASAYSLVALDGQTGQLLWRAGTTDQRTWPGIVVGDIDRNGSPEIVIAQGNGLVTAYRKDGSPLWQKQPSGGQGEFRGLLAADLDGNNSAWEIVVTRGYGSERNTWVLDAAGNVRPGWPQMPLDKGNTGGYAWGVYNANAAAGNLDGDPALELVVPSDVHYIHAYNPDGSKIAANAASYPGKVWGQVGVWESLATELRGWGECDGVRAESYRVNYADGPAAIADLNGDGLREVAVTGNMYDCNGAYTSRYIALALFNPDRSRFNTGGFDWRAIPTDTGAPLVEDYDVIETAEPNPAIADLDGDGKQEILFASYDGRLHAFWLDKTEHGSWPYAVDHHAAEGFYRFASEPLVADLDNDGKAEVIFTSWVQKGLNKTGRLHILDWSGNPIFETDLPAAFGGADWNGSLAAPTLGNLDGDPDLELAINTAHSGVVVYDLNNTASARILWGTGRGNFGRTGSK